MWRGHEFAVQKREDPMSWGWFAMVPWAGRINRGVIKDPAGNTYYLPTHWDPPHAEHGFGFHSPWKIVGPQTVELDLPEPYSPAVARQSYELEGDVLIWSLEYRANGCTLPAWIGFHPWFPRSIGGGGEAELDFKPGRMLLRGSDYLPTGEYVTPPAGPWDDAFTEVNSDPVIRWGNSVQLQITSNVPWWVVYNQDPEGICVEPQTAPPNAAELGIIGAHRMQATFSFSDSSQR